ncbi:hypothetical protein [Flavilitoribacter nigricans]|uniref:Uncharacterized protein n=1 Tax=Flavilitoribacter nigricans (strain ATCC 23147 / DSM 23189 / NBRC 102662 / NCIMB 1420 / SS-2) TaxID=1122177 RepID=A0A2D0N0E1_FLAN2|nr:hypothetical protein [Flavilitoribacter nigricans]PHN02022.1 hypothetical protein CRP01_33850 [Flavilitoribacter nigricans DSM 23189 = NBRC 102662]
MHDIEPHYLWRDEYTAEEDARSPFFGRQYDEFQFSQKVYNYYIHPQWDSFGSATLYLKIIFVDYIEQYAILELIGEWNDCLHNDIMFLKREIIDALIQEEIYKFILVCENVLNFHGDDDSYYEEWYEDIRDEDGWVCLLNTLPHVEEEMQDTRLQSFINFGGPFSDINWRPQKPKTIYEAIEGLLQTTTKRLY